MSKQWLDVAKRAGRAREVRKAQDAEIVEVLRLRGFAKNRARAGVSPAGRGWVRSDNLGLARSRNGGRFTVTRRTFHYPDFPRPFSRRLQGRQPKGPQGPRPPKWCQSR